MSAKRRDRIEENPLVPHAVLRRMYEVMLELRGLEPRGAVRRAGARGVRGEEACRASSLALPVPPCSTELPARCN